MFSRIFCAALDAIDAVIVQVEADVSDGLPVFDMVGLLASEVKESKERVRVAMKNSGYLLPPKRITVNLSPADIRKDGTVFDLPIAVAVLVAAGYLPEKHTESILFAGELSLDGSVNSVNGVLPIVYEAKRQGFLYCMVPDGNYCEATAIKGITILPVRHLHDVARYVAHPDVVDKELQREEGREENAVTGSNSSCIQEDFSSLIGQITARRAIEVAAAAEGI